MKDSTSKTGVIYAIIGAVIIISAQFFYFGTKLLADTQMSDEDFQVKVEAAIDTYVQKQIDAQQQPDEVAAPDISAVPMDAIATDDPFMGNADAKVTIVEFSDFECPYCGRYVNDAYPQIKEKYVDTDKVKYVFRDYPLDFHEGAYPAALAANCVLDQSDNAGYFAMHDFMFAAQDSLNFDTFVGYVEDMGLDTGTFTECYESDKFKDEIYADMAAGQELGIRGTPGFIINGTLISGAQPFSKFESVIEAALQ